MNIYDFDGTVYNGDSSIDFFIFCVKKNPLSAISALKTGFLIILEKSGKISKEELKSAFFSFVKYFDDIDSLAEKFWKKNSRKIFDFFIEQKKSDDFIISASPEFLLLPICKKLNINLIATKIDLKTGKILGKNCRGKEKVKRLCQEFSKKNVEFSKSDENFLEENLPKIENFYSDSISDFPLAKISESAWLVKKGKIKKWRK